MPAIMAKVFMDGDDQCVELPDAFRFEGTEVSIRREGNAIILEPISETAESREG